MLILTTLKYSHIKTLVYTTVVLFIISSVNVFVPKVPKYTHIVKIVASNYQQSSDSPGGQHWTGGGV